MLFVIFLQSVFRSHDKQWALMCCMYLLVYKTIPKYQKHLPAVTTCEEVQLLPILRPKRTEHRWGWEVDMRRHKGLKEWD